MIDTISQNGILVPNGPIGPSGVTDPNYQNRILVPNGPTGPNGVVCPFAVNISDLPEFTRNEFFIEWMRENIGEYKKEWDWTNINNPYSISIRVKDPQKAILAALRWGSK